MSLLKTMSVALSLAAAAILTASSAGAVMPGLAAFAPAATELNDVTQARGGFGGFHGGGAGGFRAGGFRGGASASVVSMPAASKVVLSVATVSTAAMSRPVAPMRSTVRASMCGRGSASPTTAVGSAGVALGVLTTAAIAGVVPAGGGDGTCWYWSNSAQTRGYWDYC